MLAFFLIYLLFFVFPYANDKRCERFPVVTAAIIVLNVLLYAADMYGMAREYGSLFESFVYAPGRSRWYTVFTYAFAHAGPFHLGFNMWFLYLIGGQVEERMGRFLFALFYLGGAWASALGFRLFALVAPEVQGIIGASGAVYALIGAYFILYPFEEFRFWYFILFRWGTLKIATLFFFGYKIFGDALYAWAQMKHEAISQVAHWAHLGGLVFGIAVALTAFGAYPFTGIKRPTYEDRARMRLTRRKARRKFYTDAPLPDPMSDEEYEAATDDCTPREAIQRGIFFHSGRMIEWGYQELLYENPKTCLEPAKQLEMIEMMRVHGRDSLAEVACWNLLDAHPRSPEAIPVRFELARSLARLPEMHRKAAALLREFLASKPAVRDQIEAERLLRRIEEKPLWKWKG